jgi:signal transduction histidine kinase
LAKTMVHVVSFRFLERITEAGAQVLRVLGWPPASEAAPRDSVGAGVFRAATEKLATSTAAEAAEHLDPLPQLADTAATDAIVPAADIPSRQTRDAAPGEVSPPGSAGRNALSTEEQAAFETIGAMLGARNDGKIRPRGTEASDLGLAAPQDEGRALPKAGLESRAILDLVPLGIMVVRDHDPIFVNRFLLDLLGLADQAAVLATGRLDGVARRLAGARLGPEVVEVEGGGVIATIASVHAICWDGAAATLACLRPCAETGAKRLEEELRDAHRQALRASALKSDFLAKVSHEIRTPLNAILGFAEVILDERFGPIGNARYTDYLKDIHASGALVMSLVNDLLDLSKIEAGKLDLAFSPVDANTIVTECVALMQPQATRERVHLRLSLWPELPLVLADERSLRQIVLNLLSNAVKFNEPGGHVVVATALADKGQALLRVKDDGIGMSDAEIEIALEPFGQVAGARPTVGTGLGLPLTKALVEANRAHFSITSKKSEGTLIEIAFPPA